MIRRRNLLFGLAPAFVRGQARPQAEQGVQSGDLVPGRALVWSRANRPARLWVAWDTTESFSNPRLVRGPAALAVTGLTARVDLTGLPPGQTIFYRAHFEDLDAPTLRSEPVPGRFRTPSLTPRDIRFLWSGDMCGQGYGINPDLGGIRIFEAMRQRNPDFFLHSGDTIYADNAIPAEKTLPGGALWKNIVTEAKRKPAAQSLDDFRGAYLYNLLDDNVRRFNAEVPQLWQWDDHEVVNNWSPARPTGLLAANGLRAFQEFAPMRFESADPERVYRRIPYGPLLDVFLIDMRSYRAANSHNRQERQGPETEFLGAAQLDWLKRELRASRATWKVIAADMPLGLLVADGKDAEGRPMFEAVANGNGPALGRELEIASLLSEIKRAKIRNTVWLTADVHYTAAHYYTPAKAKFTDFNPFWEFVSGPLNAGTFGPGILDDTFGPEARFVKAPPKGQVNLAPSAGLQFFGEVEIDARTRVLTVTLRDLTGAALHTERLNPHHR